MHPWFRPLRRRVLTLAVCLGWVAFEVWHEPGGFWFWLALGMTVYAVVHLFFTGPAADAGTGGS